uniref:Uncharacterized protein n=1 Tax=Sciurus vulgaris TaxID=55149 RepID=A0A8D2D6J5_SCIVU
MILSVQVMHATLIKEDNEYWGLYNFFHKAVSTNSVKFSLHFNKKINLPHILFYPSSPSPIFLLQTFLFCFKNKLTKDKKKRTTKHYS